MNLAENVPIDGLNPKTWYSVRTCNGSFVGEFVELTCDKTYGLWAWFVVNGAEHSEKARDILRIKRVLPHSRPERE